MHSCFGMCLEPGRFEEVFNSATNVVRLRYTGHSTTTACHFEVEDNPGDYTLTNSVPSYSVQEVFKGNLAIWDEIELLYWTDTGLNTFPFHTGAPPSDDVLAFIDLIDQCWGEDGEYLSFYTNPTDLKGPHPYQLSECNFYNSLWQDASNNAEILQALGKGSSGTSSNSALSKAPTTSIESALSDDSSAARGANSMLFWIVGFSVVAPMLLA
jgi:hypothetical protein